MKIRANYVSNSSSTSFCIVGIVPDKSHFKGTREICNGILETCEGFDASEFDGKEEDGMIMDVYNWISSKEWKSRFGEDLIARHGISEYYDQNIVGFHVCSIHDDETFLQFKTRVADALAKFGFDGTPDDIGIFIDGGYDG